MYGNSPERDVYTRYKMSVGVTMTYTFILVAVIIRVASWLDAEERRRVGSRGRQTTTQQCIIA